MQNISKGEGRTILFVTGFSCLLKIYLIIYIHVSCTYLANSFKKFAEECHRGCFSKNVHYRSQLLPDKNVTSDNTLMNERYQESTASGIKFYTFNLHYEM